MNGSAPPLRFLGLVVGGWIGVRLILLYGPALQAVPSPAPVAPAVASSIALEMPASRISCSCLANAFLSTTVRPV